MAKQLQKIAIYNDERQIHDNLECQLLRLKNKNCQTYKQDCPTLFIS